MKSPTIILLCQGNIWVNEKLQTWRLILTDFKLQGLLLGRAEFNSNFVTVHSLNFLELNESYKYPYIS
jgi:hypothetical protein